MGDARAVLISSLTTLFNYELRNEHAKQWDATETLSYVNKWLEFIHMILIEHESELVQTGSGTITTVAGTDEYALADNSMGDLLAIPHGDDDYSRVRISGVGILTLGDRKDRTAHLISKDAATTAYSQPSEYYLHGGNFCLLPFPDAVYTIYITDYMPDYTAITAVTESAPYKNLFNNVLVEGVKIIAKNRESYGTAIDAALMELFTDRAMSIIRKRQKQDFGLEPY